MTDPYFTVVADDLTGAADSCASLAGRGLRTAVFFEGGYGDGFDGDGFDAVAFDTDSRSAPPIEARRRVLEAGWRVRGATVAYKKIDSTLRGNVAVEVAAMMEASGRERAIIAPAFPGAGRMTVGGTQFVYGDPVHETEFARDSKTPVRESYLPAIFSDAGEARLLSTHELADADAVRRAIEESRFIVADATDDAHLRALVGAVPEPSRVLWVGSAGLANALADTFASPSTGNSVPPDSRPGIRGGVLVVVGSLSEVARGQLRRLGRGGAALFSVEEDVSDAKELLGAGGCVALYSPSEVGGISSDGVSGMLASAVAGLEGCFASLVMTGGDTALAVSRKLGATGIEVFGEVEPGVPFGRLVGEKPCAVVTKAGGFGEERTLLAAVEFLSDVEGSEKI